ncbi:MAG: TRAP transporter small permease [Ruminococcaceae bacterium]|nr:TRAP transporter small permease [Oscillospiraceae bacterium]
MKGKLGNVLKNLDAYFAGFMFAITLTIVIVNVFTRYFIGYIIPWGEEVATSCFVYTTFIGAAWCLRTHQHAGVDLLVDKLPEKARKCVHLLTDIIILVLNCYITYLSVFFVYSSRIKTMPILKITSIPLNLSLTFGFGLMAIYSLIQCVNDIRFWNGAPEKEDAK